MSSPARTAEGAAISGSLKLRLLALAAGSIGAALVLVWVLLTQLFEQQIAARVFAELESHLEQLTRVVEADGEGGFVLSGEPGEPRFARQFSGLYWQINGGGATPGVETSNSLWDEELTLPEPAGVPGAILRHERIPFHDSPLMAVERTLVVGQGVGEVPVRMVVAVDRAEVEAAKSDFGGRVLTLVGLVGLFLMIASAVQIFVGLRPLGDLRTRLNAVREGEAERLEGRFPTEVQGVVDELNRLLAGREEMIARARARASDLAHGLKTPLAVLGAESRRLAEAGQEEASAEIAAQIDRMNRNVERELVRARARGAGLTRTARMPLEPAVERLLRAFRRMGDGDRIAWTSAIAQNAGIAMDPVDFDEIAGNVLDNARKWATSRVAVTATDDGTEARLTIEDDGPGVPDAERANVVERGRRLDEATPGTGLGLAIARDILDLYGGRLELERSALGGLLVRLSVPHGRGGGRD